MNETLINLMADLQEEETLSMVNTLIKEGANPGYSQ